MSLVATTALQDWQRRSEKSVSHSGVGSPAISSKRLMALGGGGASGGVVFTRVPRSRESKADRGCLQR